MRKIIIFTLAWIIFGFVFALGSNNNDINSVAEMQNLFDTKMALLGNVKEENKIIISGGSNAFFGLSSETIEKLLQKKVINIALPTEGFDAALMQTLTLKAVKKGDIVLYSSLEFWQRENTNDNDSCAICLAEKLKTSEYVVNNHIYKKLYTYWQPLPRSANPATFIMHALHPKIDLLAPDYIKHIDKHGDYMSAKKTTVIPFRLADKGNPTAFIANMKRFERELATKGVKLVVLVPWILIKQNDKTEWNKHFQETMKELNSISENQTDYANIVLRTSTDDFSDTAAHLTRQMAKVRAEYVSKNTVLTNMFPKVTSQ